jgi:hypothetical protein
LLRIKSEKQNKELVSGDWRMVICYFFWTKSRGVFQVRAIGAVGNTDWSNPVSRMCAR